MAHSYSHPKNKTMSYIKLLRPYQWIKNLLLFSPLFFSGQLISPQLFSISVGIGLFCLVSSLGYILNDWKDRDTDKFHFAKKNRPFASGILNKKDAVFLSLLLITVICCTLVIYPLPFLFILYLSIYGCLTISYSLYFKHIVILEIFLVASGFVIRVLAGGAASGIEISNWLFLTVFFIALMISIAKRLNEIIELGKDTAIFHRKSHKGYSSTYLHNMLWASGSITLVVYSLYAVEHGKMVMYSVVPATYGVFRFMYLTDLGKGSDPIKTLFSDHQLILTTSIFLLFLALVIY